MLSELGFSDFSSVPLLSDSTSALHLAPNGSTVPRLSTSGYFFFPEGARDRRIITAGHVPSSSQLRGIFTKAIPRVQFNKLTKAIQGFAQYEGARTSTQQRKNKICGLLLLRCGGVYCGIKLNHGPFVVKPHRTFI